MREGSNRDGLTTIMHIRTVGLSVRCALGSRTVHFGDPLTLFERKAQGLPEGLNADIVHAIKHQWSRRQVGDETYLRVGVGAMDIDWLTTGFGMRPEGGNARAFTTIARKDKSETGMSGFPR